jgi:hypothetical protein
VVEEEIRRSLPMRYTSVPCLAYVYPDNGEERVLCGKVFVGTGSKA